MYRMMRDIFKDEQGCMEAKNILCSWSSMEEKQ